MTIEKTLATYAGITASPPPRRRSSSKNGEMGISDVLAAALRRDAGAGAAPTRATTRATKVPVMAWGPGSASFAIPGSDNEVSGQLLLDAVSH